MGVKVSKRSPRSATTATAKPTKKATAKPTTAATRMTRPPKKVRKATQTTTRSSRAKSTAEQWLNDHGTRDVAPLPVDVLSPEQAELVTAWADSGFGDHEAWLAVESAFAADPVAGARLLGHDATWDTGNLPEWSEAACRALPARERTKLRDRHGEIFMHQHTRARVIGLLAPLVAVDPALRASLLSRLGPSSDPALRAALATVWLATTPTPAELEVCRKWLQPGPDGVTHPGLVVCAVLAELLVDSDVAAARVLPVLAAACASKADAGIGAIPIIGVLAREQVRLTTRWAEGLASLASAPNGAYIAAIAAQIPNAPTAARDALISAAVAAIEVGVLPTPIANAVLAIESRDPRLAPVLEWLLGAPHVAHRPHVVAAIRAHGDPRLLVQIGE